MKAKGLILCGAAVLLAMAPAVQALQQRAGALATATADDLVKLAWTSFEKGMSCSSGEAAYIIGTPPADGPLDLSGVRGLYCHAARTLPAIVAEGLAGVPIFQSGPHKDGKLNLQAPDFGRYNPAFVQWAGDHLVPPASDAAFRKATQPIYDRHLRDLVRAYAAAQRYFDQHGSDLARIAREYKSAIDAASGDTGAGAPPARTLSDALTPVVGCIAAENSDLDYQQIGNAAAFWVRRSMDNTRGPFATALTKLLKAYDERFVPRSC